MKVIRKETDKKPSFRLSGPARTAIILVLVFLLCLGGYFLTKKIRASEDPGETPTSATKLVYAPFSFTETMDTFELTVKPDDPKAVSYKIEKRSGEDIFRLSVYNEVTTEYEPYEPDVAYEDPYFTYSDLYATDPLGLVEVWRLYYLSAGIGSLYYNEAIENVPAENLGRYGLDEQHATKFSVTFKEKADGEERAFSVLVGDKTPGGKGYFVCLADDLSTVYPTESDTLSYVEQPFSYYIKPRLVASGLTSDTTGRAYNDSSLEPYLTSDFREWKNTVVEYDEHEKKKLPADFIAPSKLTKASANPNLGTLPVLSDIVLTLRLTDDTTTYRTSDPYQASIYSFPPVLQNKIVPEIKGAELGPLDKGFSVTDVDKSAAGTIYTLEDPDVEITYTILQIEAVVTDAEDRTSGTVDEDANDLIVTYRSSKDGKVYHGCLDLSSVADGKNASQIADIRKAEIGTDVELSLTVRYGDKAVKNEYRTIVETVTGVKDAKGKDVTTATEESTVYFVYSSVVDGEVIKSYNTYVSLSADGIDATLRNILLGTKAGDKPNAVIYSNDIYGERIYHYTRLTVEGVVRYVKSEQIAGFSFRNAGERDPFYAETYYENTLPGSPYGVNAEVCENVARLLGGLEGDSSTSAGLYGTETLAVGLTPEVMAEYGLYAYTVYYELPRAIYSELINDGETEIYHWNYTLGTYLYVSEEQPDGTRYVGSSLYDVVTKVDGSVFDFLNGTFNETFARKDLVMVDIETVKEIKVSGDLDELKGTYTFQYVEMAGSDEKGYVIIPSGHFEEDETAFTAFVEKIRKTNPTQVRFNFNNFYLSDKTDEELAQFTDAFGLPLKYPGKSYFREWIQAMWTTDYSGELEDGEDGKSALEGLSPLLSLSFTLENGKTYDYRFYRVSDRQVAVELVFPGKHPSEDFYISTLAFKKIANCFVSLLNAEVVDGDYGYGG